MTTPRQAHFFSFVMASGYHEAAWRVLNDDVVEASTTEHVMRNVAIAERGLLDAAFLADAPGITRFRARFFPQLMYDPITLLTAAGQQSRRIGLVATASTTWNEPFEVARRLATADHVTKGRFAWNIVTTYDAGTARNFGREAHPEHDDRYTRAMEFVDVVGRLWDSWAEDAVIGDRAGGVWADIERIRPIDYHGTIFDVEGALPLPRPPQGWPVLAQAGSSPPGIELAGKFADVVFTPQPTVEAALAFRAKIGDVAKRWGRDPDNIKILPGIALVLGSTEHEAAGRRRELEESVDPEFRWQMLAHTAGMDPETIDGSRPLSPEAAATANGSTFAQTIVGKAMETGLPFREIAQLITGLPGGLEFTGTPEQMADTVQEWLDRGGSDGFTLLPTTLPDTLELFVDHVVPLLQRRGLFRTEYTGHTLRDHLGLPRPRLADR